MCGTAPTATEGRKYGKGLAERLIEAMEQLILRLDRLERKLDATTPSEIPPQGSSDNYLF